VAATHINKNEDRERTSNAGDNDSGNGKAPKLATYASTGNTFAYGNDELKR